jgi:hypothetical protein
MEYVIKQSQEFKTCMALRALSVWLSIETVASVRLDDIYKNILREKVNLVDMNIKITKEDLLSSKGKLIEQNMGTGQIHTVVENLLHTYINKISSMPIEFFIEGFSDDSFPCPKALN